MTHTTRLLIRTLCMLSLIASGSILADAVDDAITTHTATYDAKVTDATGLTKKFGQNRKTVATALLTELGTLATDIQAVIDNTAGLGLIPSAGQNTTLTTLKTNTETLDKRVQDHVTLSDYHIAITDALRTLAKIDVDKEQSVNQGHATTGDSAIDTQVAAFTTMHDANEVGIGTAGALKHADSVTEFASEQARATLAQELSVLVQTVLTNQANLGTAVAAQPASDDDTISNYDTALNTAQSNVETEGAAVIAAATPADTKAAALIATQLGTGDTIVKQATELRKKIDQFKTSADGDVKRAGRIRAEIGARIVQRQLLFDAVDFAQQEEIKKTLAIRLASQDDADTSVDDVVSAATDLVNVEPVEFPEVLPPPSGGDSAEMVMVKENIKKRVDAYLKGMRRTITRVLRSANRKAVDDALSHITPAVYVVQTAAAMDHWCDTRPGLLAVAGDRAATKTRYENEWTAFVSEFDANTAELSTAGIAAIGNFKTDTDTFLALDEATDSLVPVSMLPIGTNEEFYARCALFSDPFFGPLEDLKKEGNNERLRSMRTMIGQVRKNSLDAAPEHRSNKDKPAPISRPLTGSPDITVDSGTTTTTDLADGTQMVITGDGDDAGRLRDPVFADGVANKLNADLKIFLNKSARIGLGAGNMSNKPGQTLNVLGGASEEATKSVQLIPDGNCTIDVNSDLTIGGGKPFIPTVNFGKGAEHRMLFYSETPRTITVDANNTLDLSEFGNDDDEYVANGKQIVFGGKITLVLEAGAKIRFPHVEPNKESKGPVLYFNDDSRLVCKGNNSLIGKPWTGSGLLGANCHRNKLIGMGQIWFNKKAKFIINKPALVGVEADYLTPETNITISLQRDAQMLIGGSVKGGAFQVGNVLDGGHKVKPHSTDPDPNFPNTSANSDGGFVPHKTTIDFTLKIDGAEAKCIIGEGGFFGLAAGIINKDGAPAFLSAGPNGIDGISDTAWQVQRLYNVGSVTLDITRGYFDHNIIFDGNDENCSLFAIGALANNFPESKYLLRLGKTVRSFIRGGGNLYYVDKDASMVVDGAGALTANPHTVNITDASLDLSFSVANTGKTAILAPGGDMRDRSQEIDGVTDYRVFGRGIVKKNGDDSFVFAGPTEEFFYALRMNSYPETRGKYVALGKDVVPDPDSRTTKTKEIHKVSFVKTDTVYREVLTRSNVTNSERFSIAESRGYLHGATEDDERPIKYKAPA